MLPDFKAYGETKVLRPLLLPSTLEQRSSSDRNAELKKDLQRREKKLEIWETERLLCIPKLLSFTESAERGRKRD